MNNNIHRRAADQKKFQIINVTEPKAARAANGKVFHAVLVRVPAPEADVREHVDIVLSPAAATDQPGLWEVSMELDLFTEFVTTQAEPTAADITAMLLSRGGHVIASDAVRRQAKDLRQRWVHRSPVGQKPDEVMLTTVAEGKLIETVLPIHASAVSFGTVRRQPSRTDTEGAKGCWTANVLVTQRLRADGRIPQPKYGPWGPGPLRGGEQDDDGPWVPMLHSITLDDGVVIWDDQLIDLSRLSQNPGEGAATRMLVRQVLRLLNISTCGPTHAMEIYERLPRVEDVFQSMPPDELAAAKLVSQSTRTKSSSMLLPVTLIRHENGFLHFRTRHSMVESKVITLLKEMELDFGIDLSEHPAHLGEVNDISLVAEDATMTAISRKLDEDPEIRLLAYDAIYDTRTPGPTVRYHRWYSSEWEANRKPWMHCVNYGAETGVWFFGTVEDLNRALEVVRDKGFTIHQERDAAGVLQSLRLDEAQGMRIISLVKRSGFVLITDVFEPFDDPEE